MYSYADFMARYGKPYHIAEWTTDIGRAKHARDQARIEHDAASAERARLEAAPDTSSTLLFQSHSNLTTARSALYAAEGEYAALVHDADIKERAASILSDKRETVASINKEINALEDEGGDSIADDLGWDFLDKIAEDQIDAAVVRILSWYRDRVLAS